MNQDIMFLIFVIGIVLGIVVILTTKEEKKKNKGIVKFIKETDQKLKYHPHTSTIYTTHFLFEVDGDKKYEKVVNSLRCDRQLREQLNLVDQEMEYFEIYRTNLFVKTPYFYKLEIPYIDNLK